MEDINGCEVFDLIVEVPPPVFISKVEEVGASILGLSGLLTLAFDPIKETIELLKSKGLAGRVKVMIGVGPVDEQGLQVYRGGWLGKGCHSCGRISQSLDNQLI